MAIPLGYSELISRYQLRTLPLLQVAKMDGSIKGREVRQQGEQRIELFEPKYQPEDSLAGHLQFALRYEGVNLQVLALLFADTGAEDLTEWLTANPESRYARIACFLYEWLTVRELPMADPVSSRSRYVLAVDPEIQCVGADGIKSQRFRVTNNLPGPREFCPLVFRTAFLKKMQEQDLKKLTIETLARYDQYLLRRAAAYLYMKETQSSFEVEREKPSPQRAQRFADLLRQADTREELSEERLVELQQAVVDPRFHEFTWRTQQNWVGKDLGHRHLIDFVPARPEHLPALMSGLLHMASMFQSQERVAQKGAKEDAPFDPVVAAAAIAFGFVFIHPFMDGNGRIHRYLIHDVLAKAGFTPRGLVLPVSAVILVNLDEYISTLEQFSRPLNQMTDYNPDAPEISATGNDCVYFQYPDLTVQAEFLYKALERTVTQDLQKEIDFLLGFDRASKALNELLDWPAHDVDIFIRVVHGNNGRLSSNKRKSHFAWMTEEEILHAEEAVREAFAMTFTQETNT